MNVCDERTFLNGVELEDIDNVKNPKFNLYVYYEVVNGKTYLKFGQTTVSAYERYNQTGDTQHDRMLKVWNSSLTDKQVHRELQKIFKKADFEILNTDEAYEITSLEEYNHFIKTINSLVAGSGVYRYFDFEPREYQRNIIEQTKTKLANRNEVLLNLSTRCGKSFITLSAALEMGMNNILIITPFPKAEKSFREIASYHKKFEGYNYINFNKDTELDLESFKTGKNIVFISFQYFDIKKVNVQELTTINFDLLIVDEEHNTSDSFRSADIIAEIKSNKKIFMSGTPFNDIWSGRFSSEDTITFDFIDFIEYSKTHDDIKLPELYIKNVDNISEIKKSLFDKFGEETFKDIDVFNYDTIFSQDRYAEWYFKWLVDEENVVPKNSNDWFELSKQNNIILFVDERKHCDVVYNALKNLVNDSNSAFSGFNIIKVSGNENTQDSSETKINESLEKNKRNIIISCSKLTTGVTIEKLDTIWYFRNTESAELFIQILFRIMTTSKGKDKSQMYCFNGRACLKAFQEYASYMKEQNGDSFQNSIERILKCINFTHLKNNFEWENETPYSFLKRIRDIPFAFRPQEIFSNLSKIDLSKLVLNCDEISEKDIKITDGEGKEKSISSKEEQKSEKTKKKPVFDLFASVRKKLYNSLKLIDRVIFINIDEIETYKDLEKFPPKELSEKYLDVWKILLENNKTKLNQMIDDVKYKIEEGKSVEIYKNLTMANDTDYRTPPELIEKMINYFNNAGLEREDTYFDPCCGTGSMLLYLHEEYGIPLNNLYGVDISPSNVELCHSIGLTNVICGDILKDIKEIREMHFDKIIMNPPYDRSLHLKILRQVMNKANEVVNLSPIRWLQDPLAEMKGNRADYGRFADIRSKITSLEVVSASQMRKLFGSEEKEEGGIYYLTPEGGMNITPKPFISQGLFDKVNKPTYEGRYRSINTVRTAEGKPNYTRPFVRVPNFYGNDAYAKSWSFVISPNREIAMTPNKKPSKVDATVNFNTQEEAENFFDYLQTKFVKACNANVKTNIRNPAYAIPYMEDYTNSWTDEMLYEYFGLTDDEIQEIEQAV